MANQTKIPSLLYKETLSKNEQVPVQKPTGKRFAMLPADVLANPRLNPAAKLAYAALAMESYGSSDTLTVSHGALGRLCGVARTTVLMSLEQLESEGLIARVGAAVKQVQPYRLLHPRFAAGNEKSPREEDKPELVTEPMIEAQARPRCVTCRKRRKLNRAGTCWSCVSKADMRQVARDVVREELAKVAS